MSSGFVERAKHEPYAAQIARGTDVIGQTKALESQEPDLDVPVSLAESETYAHLEWLRLHGGATRTEIGGLALYEL